MHVYRYVASFIEDKDQKSFNVELLKKLISEVSSCATVQPTYPETDAWIIA